MFKEEKKKPEVTLMVTLHHTEAWIQGAHICRAALRLALVFLEHLLSTTYHCLLSCVRHVAPSGM